MQDFVIPPRKLPTQLDLERMTRVVVQRDSHGRELSIRAARSRNAYPKAVACATARWSTEKCGAPVEMGVKFMAAAR